MIFEFILVLFAVGSQNLRKYGFTLLNVGKDSLINIHLSLITAKTIVLKLFRKELFLFFYLMFFYSYYIMVIYLINIK
jgi:hypothetical protein